MRAVTGEIYLHVLLRMYDVSKKILINSIEKGEIAHIASELSVERLPPSFRFYDPILLIVKNGLSEGAKDGFKLKQDINRQNAKRLSGLQALMKNLHEN